MELSKEDIINWGLETADFKQLEDAAKALYALYIQERKQKYPEEHKKAKQYKKNSKYYKKNNGQDSLYWRHKKKKGTKLDEFKQKPYVKPTIEYRK